VFVELPMREALAPIYASLLRTGGLLLVGLAVAMVTGLFLSRRMVGPIRALQAGAALIGAGDLGRRIEVRTGDELENLADAFNEMAQRLTQSRQELERRVEERTAELGRSVEELRALGRLLEQASAHKSRFLANMSHELRTPLNAILGFTELLIDGIYGGLDARARQVVERVQANGSHLLALINDVLDLSKIEAGELVLTIAPFDLGDVVRDVVAVIEPLARAKNLALSAEVEPGMPAATGDQRRVRQVLLNLVGNAVKFTDRGFVRISVGMARGLQHIAVADSGPGIDSSDQVRIFREFHQVDSSETRTRGGSGLGLSISKRIVDLHGGTISVASEIGRGAIFTVALPAMGPPIDARSGATARA
jgi:signal transduction histidine kinase